MKKSEYVKVVTHIPLPSLKTVQKAIWDIWAGKEWKYSHCSFIIKGKGFFTPLEESNPTIGEIWKAEEVEEFHLEFTCHRNILDMVILKLKKVHPYEEAPIQIFDFFEV